MNSSVRLFIVVVYVLIATSPINMVPAAKNLDCLDHLFTGEAGKVGRHDIPLEFTGRITLGDLDANGHTDFIISGSNRIMAYNLCGQVLWDHKASTNWSYDKHKYWYMTSYGYIGDVDLDGVGEFLHIGQDWRTLFVRNGLTGQIKQQLKLPDKQWMYVLLGRRQGEVGEQASRVFVVSPAYYQDVSINAYDFRDGKANQEWSFHLPSSKAGGFAYVTPQAANLDGDGGDEIFFAGLALEENGQPIWLYNTTSMSAGGMHMLSVKDIDPQLAGLETVISLYGPHRGEPSLLSFANANRKQENWRAFSPHKERHPHQHTVGDFDPSISGLETLARNNNGLNHWMADRKGNVIRKNWRVDPGWQWRGEYVQAIDWDSQTGSEVLYVERHVGGNRQPRLRIVSPLTDSVITPMFTARSNQKSTFTDQQRFGFNPFEAAAHVVDLIGDGREEVLTWGNNKISIFYNSGDAKNPKQ